MLAYSYGQRFELVDLRETTKMVPKNEHVYSTQTILDIDFNPIKMHTIASAGQDSCIRFWDTRKLENGRCVFSFNQTDILSQNPYGHTDQKLSVLSSSNRNSSSNLGN